MSEPRPGTLMRLSDTGRTIASGDPDIRGRTVKDSTGEDIGRVEELLVDPDDETRHHIAGAPPYDPELTDQNDYYSDLYGYYGYPPFWRTSS